MEYINRIRSTSIWIFIVPVLSLNLCLFISVNYHLLENTIFVVDQIGRSGFTIPYIDGGISISRSARTYPTYLLFKPAMLLTSFFLIRYWILNNKLFQKINSNLNNNYFLFFGVASAFFLILHSALLGVEFEIDIYKFFRRFILLAFIIFEIAAQILLVISIIKSKSNLQNLFNKKILILKIILVTILVVVAIFSLPILNSSEFTHFKHALEWNYFLGVVSFYLLTFLFWKSN